MILVSLILVGAAVSSVEANSSEWNSLNHGFACRLHTAQGLVIPLEGTAKETVIETEGQRNTKGYFAFRSFDPAWRFLSGSSPTSGGGIVGTHTLHFDNIDDPSKEGFKPYSLQLTFAGRIDGVKGPYGYALLRDQSVGLSRVQQGSEHPIIALGICNMTPKAGTSK